MERTMNPSQIGLITEYKCQLYLIENGFNVLMPIGNYQKYDLVIEKNGKFTRIQVKHASSQNDGESFLVRTKYEVRNVDKIQRMEKQKYTKEDTDYFMTEYDNQFYIFPVFDTVETKFWLKEVRNTNQKKASDYLAEKVLQNL